MGSYSVTWDMWDLAKLLAPSYSSEFFGSAALTSPRHPLETRILYPTLNHLDLNLCFNKIPSNSYAHYTLRKHCLSGSEPQPSPQENGDNNNIWLAA